MTELLFLPWTRLDRLGIGVWYPLHNHDHQLPNWKRSILPPSYRRAGYCFQLSHGDIVKTLQYLDFSILFSGVLNTQFTAGSVVSEARYNVSHSVKALPGPLYNSGRMRTKGWTLEQTFTCQEQFWYLISSHLGCQSTHNNRTRFCQSRIGRRCIWIWLFDRAVWLQNRWHMLCSRVSLRNTFLNTYFSIIWSDWLLGEWALRCGTFAQPSRGYVAALVQSNHFFEFDDRSRQVRLHSIDIHDYL